MTRNPAPGGAMLHPIALVALSTLVLNDHLLKRLCPGILTGKLSDFAGVVLLPLFLHALLELGAAYVRRQPLTAAAADRTLVVCVAVALLMFALPEVWRPAELVYRYGLSTLRWPFRALWALASGGAPPQLRPVRATADISDLLAMPMAFVALRVGQRERSAPRLARVLVVAGVLAGASLTTSNANAASQPLTHDGFYLSAEAGPGLLWADSSGSLSNNFMQKIPSSTLAPAAPAMSFALGGTFARLGLTLGGRLGIAKGTHPVVRTLDTRFSLPNHDLLLLELAPFAAYFPDPRRGLYFGGSLGFAWLGMTGSSAGAAPGFSGSLEIGDGFFFARQWSLGGTLRFSAARTFSLDGPSVATTTLLPAVLATVTLH